ncbi:MAG TPA: hypothetical protein VGH79_04880 [Gaiellaceae bacterium]|jgi:hypothetical protein
MSRFFAFACGLVLVAAVVTGCGSGYQAAVRQESKQLLANGNPKIMRIETVRDLAGNKQIVATLEGHFKFPPANMPCERRCGQPPRYAWIMFSEPAGMTGFGGVDASTISAIANAHRAKRLFDIFPYTTMTGIRCVIPRGASGTVDGRCRTDIAGMHDHRPSSIMFHEGWGDFGHRRDGGWGPHQRGGGWIVALDPHGRVQSVRRFGDLPPQLWK